MKIDNLKQLQKVIQLCTKHGVQSITIDGVSMVLSPIKRSIAAPVLSDFSSDIPEAKLQVPSYDGVDTDKIDTDELSPEQLLFYSSAGTEQ